MKQVHRFLKMALMVIALTIGMMSTFGQTTVGPFTYYPTNQGGTMQGQAQIGGVPAVSGDIIAAFDPSGECVGAALLIINSGTAYISFVIYGDDGGGHGMSPGEAFTLKLYDASATTTITYPTTFTGWQNTNFAPMPGYNTPTTVYNFISCTLSVTPASQNVTPVAGTTNFSVATTCAWTATSNQTWCTVTPSGTGNGTLAATYTANQSSSSRTANITVTVAGVTPVTVQVLQEGGTISVSPSSRSVTAAPGTTTFTITSNTNWSVSSNQSWCTVSPSSGSGNTTITATYNQNTTSSSRSASLTFSSTGLSAVVTFIVQAAPTLSVNPLNQSVTKNAGTTTFTVTSNSVWNVAETETWFSVSPAGGTGGGSFTVTYDANTGPARTGTLNLSASGATTINVTVSQESGCSLSVTPLSQNVTAVSGSTVFTITTSCPWTVTESETWLSVTPSGGTGNGTFTVNYDANSGTERTGSLTITVSGLTPVNVTVIQAASQTQYLTVTPSNRDVTSVSGSTTFTVSSNTSWTVTDNASWLAISPTSGNNNGTLTATYSSNSGAQRVATITITGTGVSPASTVTVTQAAPVVTKTITIGSQNPASGVAITVTPNDNSGNGNGTTQFTRVYNTGTSVTLTAPATASGNVFSKWIKNSADFSTNAAITFNVADNDNFTAVYVTPTSVAVHFPDTTLMSGQILEVPVYVSSLTGAGILSFQFTFTFDQSIISPVDPYVITTGTLSSMAGWSVIANPNVPGQLTIGGIGTDPLTGSGKLLKIKFNVTGSYGDESPLDFTSFTFNNGIPTATLTDGSVTIPPRVCGDADENNLIQAYDAALTLQHAVGLIVLSAQAQLNADVNEDETITAWDATLTLRHSISLPMPGGVSTCFTAKFGFSDELPRNYKFNAFLYNYGNEGVLTTANIKFTGIEEPGQVYSVSFDIRSPHANIHQLNFTGLPTGYVFFGNQVNEHVYRIGVINPNGILAGELNMMIKLSGFNDGTPLSVSDIKLNDFNFGEIILSGTNLRAFQSDNLLEVYPNPFSYSTQISYRITEDQSVNISIYDQFGRKIKTLVEDQPGKGYFSVLWNGDTDSGAQIKSGWYIVRLINGSNVAQIKLNLTR